MKRVALVVIPVACLALTLLPGRSLAEPTREADPEVPVKTIKMTAENWKWHPHTIRVKQGTRVVIEFQSYDATHSFVLKAYGIKVNLPEGKRARVEFTADRIGEFPWRCGRPCGDGCAKMRGTLIVQDAAQPEEP